MQDAVLEKLCRAVSGLPRVNADANVFVIDDFSGQIQGTWADKRIIWTDMFQELKRAGKLPEKSNLIVDFWPFVEEWVKRAHEKNPKLFPKDGKKLSFKEKKDIFRAYLRGHSEYTNGHVGRFGHITLLPAVVNSYGSLVMDLSRYNLANTRDYSADSLFIALDEGTYAYDYQGNILIKSMKELREELYEKQEDREYWGAYYSADQWEFSHDMRELVAMPYDWELSENALKLFASIKDMDHEFDLRTRESSNHWDDLGDRYRSFTNSEGATIPAGRSKPWKKLHYATLPLNKEEYDFQVEVLKAQLQFEAEHPEEELWTRGDTKRCGSCGQRYHISEICCPRCFACNNDKRGLTESVGLSSVWEYVYSPEDSLDGCHASEGYRFGDTEIEP